MLFERAVSSLEKKDDVRAKVYSTEHSELSRVISAVNSGELALSAMAIRMESIKDVGEVAWHISSAFTMIRNVGKELTMMHPVIAKTSEELNSKIADCLTKLEHISSGISFDLEQDDAEELIRKAKEVAEERALQSDGQLKTLLPDSEEAGFFEKAKKIAMQGHAKRRGRAESELEEMVMEHVSRRGGQVNLLDISVSLNLSIEEVEQALISLISSGRLNLEEGMMVGV